MKQFTSIALIALMGAAVVSCKPKVQEVEPVETSDEVILHAWSWNFNTIAENMKDIAQAGYDYVQTSPANTCYVGENGGLALFSQPGDEVEGKWYYYYQPTDWKIGNYLLGNRDEFKNMMDSANKYGVKVIVDVLPNHTAIDHKAVLPDLDAAVGGHENLYHANGFTPIVNWNDRLECTTGEMGGLPDVNTENPAFQEYYMNYINDLISLGVRGFRYDTAKHIGLPSDPLDPKVEQNNWRNNFWDVATGREAVNGVQMLMPDSIFIYGEVLQDKNVKEEEYAEYMDQTASSYGHAIREALEKGSYNAADLKSWHHPVDANHLVTWVESHDTYANEHESAGIDDEAIRAGYVFLTARQSGRPLFFSRPAGSTRENYWGNNKVGERGNDEFKNPEVVAAIAFRKAMSGMPEEVVTDANGAVVEVNRGHKGVTLINFTNQDQKAELPTQLPDGEYTDAVHNQTFLVSNGEISGELAPYASYILYAK